eukprot:m.41785 g.41785  ORF g.41785 m.41785 type:complete len:537 (+) comp9810_c0_seq2:257-1867(+)
MDIETNEAYDPDNLRGCMLDAELKKWREKDAYALDSSVFSKAGVLASPRAQVAFMVIGMVFLIGSIAFMFTAPGWGLMAIIILSTEGILLSILMNSPERHNAAVWLLRFSMIPVELAFMIESVCYCDQDAIPVEVCFFGSNSTDPEATKIRWCQTSIVSTAFVFVLFVVVVVPAFGRYQLLTGMAFFGYLGIRSGVVYLHEHQILGSICILGGSFIIFLVAWFMYRRRLSKKQAEALIEQDRLRYEGAWQRALYDMKEDPNKEHGSNPMEVLEKAWSALEAATNPFPRDYFGGRKFLQPYNRKFSELYDQADLVNEWYQTVIASWHNELNGNEDTYKPCHIKKTSRAIEKVKRTYLGQFRRVCDMVRATLVCRDLNHIAQAIHIIVRESKQGTVRIVRSKNRFSSSASQAKTAGGYRDIQISLMATGYEPDGSQDEELTNKCKQHIMELQIHLGTIYKVKSDLKLVQFEDEVLARKSREEENIKKKSEKKASLQAPLLDIEERAHVLGFGHLKRADDDILTSGHARYVRWRTIMGH